MSFPNILGQKKTLFYGLLIAVVAILVFGTIVLRGKSPTKTYCRVGGLSEVILIRAYDYTVLNQTEEMAKLCDMNISEKKTGAQIILQTERPANLIRLYINQSVFDSKPTILALKISVNGSQDFTYTLRVWKSRETTHVSIGNWTLSTMSHSISLANLQIHKGLAVDRNKTTASDLLELSVTDGYGADIKENKIEHVEIEDLVFIREETGRMPPQLSLSDPVFSLLSLYFLLILFFLPLLFLKKKGKSALPVILILGFLLRIGITPLTSHNFDVLGCKRAVRTYYEEGGFTLFNTWTSPPTWFFVLIAFHAPYVFLRVLGVPDFRIYYQPVLAIEVLFIKLPLILSDVLSAYLIYGICKKRNLDGRISRLASAVFMFNPFSIFISSIWGMFDSLAVLFMLLGLYFFLDNRFLASSLMWGLGVKWYTLGFIPFLSMISFYKDKEESTANRLLTSILIIVIGFGIFVSLLVIPHILNGNLDYMKQVLNFRLKTSGGGEDFKSAVTFFGPVLWKILERALSINPFPNFFLFTFGAAYLILLITLFIHLRKFDSEKTDSLRVLNNATIATLLLFYLTYPQLTAQCVLWILPSLIFAYFIFHQIRAIPLVTISLLVLPYLDTAYFIMGFPAPLNISPIQAISSTLECVFGILIFLIAVNFLLKTFYPELHIKVGAPDQR